MILTKKQKFISIIKTGIIMFLGLLLFKFLPQQIFGKEILFDASFHLTIAILILYTLWYFIDQNAKWRMPYIIFSIIVITLVSMQRMLSNEHNDIGLLIALLISFISIIIPRWDYFKGKFNF